MLNLHEIETAIQDLQQGSMTYNNCMKLASLYVIRDELYKRSGQMNYSYNPTMMGRDGNYNYHMPQGYYPMYTDNMNTNGRPQQNYNNYNYESDDLIIRKNPKEIY